MNGLKRRGSRPDYNPVKEWPAGLERCRRLLILILICAISLANGGGQALAAAPQQPEQVAPLAARDACTDAGPNQARCLAKVSTDSFNSPHEGVVPGTSGGYGPAEFHTAYQLPCQPGGAVASICATPGSFGPETIAIVDAGGYGGNLETDLQTYNNYYGLPACTIANGCLTVVNQDGNASPLPPEVSSGWTYEIALDVQTAHMICQTCKIVLVEADDNYTNNMSAAEATAATFSPIAISNSWGASVDQTSYNANYQLTGVAVVAATGDDGTVTGGQSWPADIPEVVAAAGTTLQLNGDNTWASETVWSGSGGGCSVNYSAPSWQTSRSDWAANGCSGGGRAFGDLSAAGNPSTGAAIAVGSSWYLIGGTSLSTPLIASMYALAADLPAGTQAVAVPYQNASGSTFHDIVSGNDCTAGGQPNCTATTGFDVPSGLGSPNGLGAFLADPSPPSNLTASYVGPTQLDLSWTAASATNGVADYQIYKGGSLLTSTSSLSYSDTGLTANSNYTYYWTTTDNSSNVSVPSASITGSTYLPSDINEDTHVNLLDFSVLASKYSQCNGGIGRSDINTDGCVNLLDFSLLAVKYGTV